MHPVLTPFQEEILRAFAPTGIGSAGPRLLHPVFFIDRELYPFRDLLANARRKHIGMDNFWLAQSLRKVEAASILPRMLKPLRLEEMKEFFLDRAEKLIDDLKG